jgi:hypothetical protein
MGQTIANALSTIPITVTQKQSDALVLQVLGYELRRSHPLALNSQGLGIYPIVFTDLDREALFTIFNVDEKHLRGLIQKLPAINPEFKVRSDPFNILSAWLLHLSYREIADVQRRDIFQMAVAKYLHYRFFSSLVNHYFPHGAVEKNMLAAIKGLSRKFDIVVYGTWKAAIEARCRDLIAPDSLHHAALLRADDDEKFLYVIQDVQTRVRDKVKNITAAYYAAHAAGDAIGSRSATTETEQGKILVHTAKTLDLMIYNMQNEIMITRQFVDAETVRKIAAQASAVSEDMLRSALLSLVDLAATQRDSGQLDIIRMNDGYQLYIGMRVFLANVIQKTYRHCMSNGVDITNKAAILIKAKNIYSSSRISDEDILSVKQSVAYLVDLISTSRRETTKSSLRLALLQYILVRSFRFL